MMKDVKMFCLEESLGMTSSVEYLGDDIRVVE